MIRTIADFETLWTNERDSSLKLLRALTDSSLTQSVTPEGRTLGRLAWHIVQTHGEMGGHTGLTITPTYAETPQPASAAAYAEAYETSANALLAAVKAAWTDEDLPGEVNMYGEMWPRGVALDALVRHEIHHRGQMTVLMRQAGLKVPGIYGPAREEWAVYGMPTQD